MEISLENLYVDIGAKGLALYFLAGSDFSGYLELRSGMWVPVYIVTFCND